jgi:hypothetical protein
MDTTLKDYYCRTQKRCGGLLHWKRQRDRHLARKLWFCQSCIQAWNWPRKKWHHLHQECILEEEMIFDISSIYGLLWLSSVSSDGFVLDLPIREFSVSYSCYFFLKFYWHFFHSCLLLMIIDVNSISALFRTYFTVQQLRLALPNQPNRVGTFPISIWWQKQIQIPNHCVWKNSRHWTESKITILQSFIFWDMTHCCLLKVNQRFEGKPFHL